MRSTPAATAASTAAVCSRTRFASSLAETRKRVWTPTSAPSIAASPYVAVKTSAPGNCGAREASRTTSRVGSPAAARPRATAPPTAPAEPVTAIMLIWPPSPRRPASKAQVRAGPAAIQRLDPSRTFRKSQLPSSPAERVDVNSGTILTSHDAPPPPEAAPVHGSLPAHGSLPTHGSLATHDAPPTHDAPSVHQRRRLGDVLVERGLVTPEQLTAALATQQTLLGKQRKRLGKLVVDLGFVTERQVAEALAALLSLDLLEQADLAISLDVARLLPRPVAERDQVLVLGRTTDGLRIATADPTNVVALDDVRAYTGSQTLTLVVATASMIHEQIARVWSMGEDPISMSNGIEDDEVDDITDEAVLVQVADQAPTVKLVNQLLADAVRVGASDIHVEQQADGIWIRHRIDGVLRDVTRMPKSSAPALVSRLKIVAGMDIAQRRLPQDGRMRITANGVAVDARVSTLPSVNGEKVVIRLLPDADRITPLDRLGMEPAQLQALVSNATASQGLVLITGPTGSGKTNTLYSLSL